MRISDWSSDVCSSDLRVQPLMPREDVFEINERRGADGRVDRPLDREQVVHATRQAKARGVDGVVVCFLHSYRNPEHEQLAREIVQATEPDLDVTLSSEVWPEQGEYERCVISTLNGFVKRRMDSYIGKLERSEAHTSELKSLMR